MDANNYENYSKNWLKILSFQIMNISMFINYFHKVVYVKIMCIFDNFTIVNIMIIFIL